MDSIQELLEKRYYHSGETEWGDICNRVVRFFKQEEHDNWYISMMLEELYHALRYKEILPSSPVLMNAGLARPMLNSCFVLPVQDSIKSITKSLADTIKIQKYGGGVGINFSHIRPEGSLIKSTGGQASGPVSFMGLWNEAMNVIRQGGKRQGAMMGVLNVGHKDLMLFLNAKTAEDKLTNFNLSVALNKEFFEDLWTSNVYKYASGLTAEEIMHEIASHAWQNGEPGVLFMDNINKNNPYPVPIDATNPCGEVPLPPYGACCLGSINLAKHVMFDHEKSKFVLNRNMLQRSVDLAVFMLLLVNKHSWWPTKRIARFMKEFNPIGLGVMGLADTLAYVGLPYDMKDEGTKEFIHSLFSTIKLESIEATKLACSELKVNRPVVLRAIAPTGTIAMIGEASYSIEPYFSLSYTKQVEAGNFKVENKVLRRVLEMCYPNITVTKEDEEIINRTGSLSQTTLPESLKRRFLTANEIPPITHLELQAAVQTYVDSAVSKTVNLPNSITKDEIVSIIVKAHALGVKGLTVYRAGSRDKEVIECVSGVCSL